MVRHKKVHTKATIEDVARDANVSITTVSRVINKAGSVKEANRKRVLYAVKKLHFRPNITAQHLAGGRINTIALIIPKFFDMFHSFYVTEVLRAVSSTITDLNRDLLIHLTEEAVPLSDPRILSIANCAGALFADIYGNEILLKELLNEKVPCVVMNYYNEELLTSCVAVDNRNAAIEAVKYLISIGHKRIATITGDLKVQAGFQRLEGYKIAHERARLPIKDEYIYIGDFAPHSGRYGVERLLELDKIPTAIFVGSDDMAIEAIKTIQEKGLNVPADISVVGFDDNWLASQIQIPLTTVRQPLDQMGIMAAELLNEFIKNPNKKIQRILLTAKLIVRNSSASPVKNRTF